MKYPVTPSFKNSASIGDLTEVDPTRGRTRRRLSLEFFSPTKQSSTPIRDPGHSRRVQRSLSVTRRYSLGFALEESKCKGMSVQDCSSPMYGRYTSPIPARIYRSHSTNSPHLLDVTPVSSTTSMSNANVSEISSVASGSYLRARSTANLQITCDDNHRPLPREVVIPQNKGKRIKRKLARAAKGSFSGRRSGSLTVVSNSARYDDDYINMTDDSLNATPTSYSTLNYDSDAFLPADQHPDFCQEPAKKQVKTKENRRLSAKALFGTRRFSCESDVNSKQSGKVNGSVTPSQISRKKRRASDIGIREFFDAAKRYSRREKEPRIEEELNMPKLKKLPMAKKTKSPANGIRTTPDKTLQEVLKRKTSILRFRAFLQSEFSEENLDFWIECEAYKHQKIYKQRKLAGKIYEKYVAAQAPREINLDCISRKKIKCSIENPDSKTFEIAQNKIFRLMERDSYRRYVVSLKKTVGIAQQFSVDNDLTPIVSNGNRKISL